MGTQFLRRPRVFYGYWVVLATFLCVFVLSGTAYCFGLFVKPLQVDLGWSRGNIAVAFTILFSVQAIASPFIGRIVDRYDVRPIIITGAIMGSLGFILLTQTHHLWQFYLGYAIIGIGFVAIGPVPASAIINNWFEKKRGLVIGMMFTGMGVGGFTITLLVGGYLLPNFGWRTAYLALAIITWILIIPIVLLVVRTRPADKGLHPYGLDSIRPAAVTEFNVPAIITLRFTTKMVLATSAFWLIAISSLTRQISSFGIVQSQTPHLEDIGFPVVTAAAAIGGIGLGSIIGYFIFGWMCDRILPRYASAIGIGLQLISAVILINVELTSPTALLWLYVVIMGLGVGSMLPTISMLTSNTFGLASYGTIFGMVSLLSNTGAATGPLIAGHIQDAMQTYDLMFTIVIALFAICIPLVLLIHRPD